MSKLHSFAAKNIDEVNILFHYTNPALLLLRNRMTTLVMCLKSSCYKSDIHYILLCKQ